MSCKDKYLHIDEDTRRLMNSIKHKRKKLRLNQSQLAEIIGVHKSEISRYESGKNFPSLSIFLGLAEFFNWDISGNINFLFNRSLKVHT